MSDNTKTQNWVCERCAHQWSEDRPEGDDPASCENCGSRELTSYSNPDLADAHSSALVSRKEIIADAETHCDGLTSVAVQSESSKFERVMDRELAAALSILQMNGAADEEFGATDVTGFYARIGPYILLEVGAGFIYIEEFPTDWDAKEKFTAIEEEYPEYDQ